MATEDNASTDSQDDSAVEPRETIGPTTAALKARFRSQSIPLEQDFADLIDIADIGRRAVGANPDQDGVVGAGLTQGSAGKLMLNAAAPFTLSVANGLGLSLGYELAVGTSNDLYLKHGTDSGIGATADRGAYVNVGNGVTINSSNQLTLHVASSSGLSLSANGLSIKAKDPISADADGLGLKLGWGLYVAPSGNLGVLHEEIGSGLDTTGERGLFVVVGPGVNVNSNNQLTLKALGPFTVDATNGLSVKLGHELAVGTSGDLTLKHSGTDSGIGATAERGAYVNVGPGLKINSSNQLVYDPNYTFSPGMIVLLNTDVPIPDGWALCDGTNGTPNLMTGSGVPFIMKL